MTHFITIILALWAIIATASWSHEYELRQQAESREYWLVTDGAAQLAVRRMEIEALLPSERRRYNDAIARLEACRAALREGWE
jgi:hypothetical protein